MKRSRLAVIGLTLTLLIVPATSTIVSGEEFYRGKTMKLLVPFPPGGGWDTYGRTAAKYITKYIPGKPSIIVQNMPGASGMVGVNFLYNRVKPDGLTIGMFQTTNAFLQLAGDSAVQFDVRRASWLGAFSSRVSTCVVRTDSPFKTIQDVIGSKEPLYSGAVSRGGGTTMEPMLMNKLLKTNFKVVSGYPGTSAIRMALRRGEVQGICGWGWSSVKSTGKELLENGTIRVLVQIAHRREPDIPPDVPLITDLVPSEMKPLLNVYLIPASCGLEYDAAARRTEG
ncbi:MAG: hypothetical protein GTO40_24570 [Deltaproteobacteria bacterium]|nr:hypothetical protein [Deltaproteobacteria bacterium]